MKIVNKTRYAILGVLLSGPSREIAAFCRINIGKAALYFKVLIS